MAFIAVVIGVSLLTSTANATTAATQQNSVVNESIVLVNATAVALDYNQLDALTTLANATNGTDTLTVNTDYTVDLSSGEITSLGRAGTFHATYTYRQVGNQVARTLTNLIVILFALGVFGAVLYYLSPQFRELMQF
jgi:hypothetical protein